MSAAQDIEARKHAAASPGFGRLSLICLETAALIVLSTGAYSDVASSAYPLIAALAWFPSVLKSFGVAAVFAALYAVLRHGWRSTLAAHLEYHPPRALLFANLGLFAALAGWLIWSPALRELTEAPYDFRTLLYFASTLVWFAFAATVALLVVPAATILRVTTLRGALVFAALAAGMFGYFYFGLPIGDDATEALIVVTVKTASAIYSLFGGSITFVGREPDGDPIYAAGSFIAAMEPSCSGTQGMLLVTLIALVFVALERRRLHISRVLLLVPFLALVMFVINAARIAILFYIGAHWSAEIAINGFHANFGVLSVAVVSVLFVVVVQLAPSLARPATAPVEVVPQNEPDVRLIAPLAVLIGVSLVTGLFTGSFNWLYPLPILAAAATLYWARDAFAQAFDDISLVAVATGIGVFIVWVWLIPPDAAVASDFAAALYGASPWLAALWLLMRLAGAVLIVPLAEEMAFRSFLQTFIAQHLTRVLSGPLAIAGAVAGASLMFGLAHSHVLAGVLAGFGYGLVFLHRNRLGDAVVAHAFTNLLIALYVLLLGRWSYW